MRALALAALVLLAGCAAPTAAPALETPAPAEDTPPAAPAPPPNRAPGAPALAFPPDGARDVASTAPLHWQPSTDPDGDALRYRLTLRDDTGLATTLYACASATVSTLCDPAPTLEPGHTYVWHVSVYDGGRGVDSARWTFTTAAPPPEPAADPDRDDTPNADEPAAEEAPPETPATPRPPVLFVHGWTGDRTTWEAAARAFEEETDIHVLRDPTGSLLEYGPQNGGTTIEEFAEDVAIRARSMLAINGYTPDAPVTVVAHSMGGLVTRYLIETRELPNIERLIMVGTPNGGVGTSWVDCDYATWKDSADWNKWGGYEGWQPSCEQMLPRSTFLRETLPPREARREYRFVVGIWDDDDDGLVDSSSVVLDGGVATTLRGVCHAPGEMPDDEWECPRSRSLTTADAAIRAISEFVRE